jgi:hypothetical protein
MTVAGEGAMRVEVGDGFAVPFRARLQTGGPRPGALRIAGWLTPYEMETLAMEARGLGSGARLELRLGANTSDRRLEWVRRRFAGLGRRGIEVSVRRDGESRTSGAHASGLAVRARGQRGG